MPGDDCMVSCMVFLLYSTKWRTETHADSVPVGEDGVTEGVGRYPAPMAACTAAWAHPGHAPLPRHARQGCMAGCMEFRCISLYFAVCRSIQQTRLVTPSPRRHTAIQRHTAPYSAIQRCMSIQLYSTIQHTPHTTPLRCPGHVVLPWAHSPIWSRQDPNVCLSYPNRFL